MKKTTAKNHILTNARTKPCICMILSILFIYMLVCVPIPVKAAEKETSDKVVRLRTPSITLTSKASEKDMAMNCWRR